MSQAREIRNKISSIKSTQKITRAMELVAASKMRKAQDRMSLSKPYSEKIRKVIGHVAAGSPEYPHPFLKEREKIQRVGFIVVTSDRGLCGGLNINLLRRTLKEAKNWEDQGVGVDLCLVGRKGEAFFKNVGGSVLALADHLGDAPKVQDLIGVVKVMIDAFKDGKIDAIYIATNEFINTMTQRPVIRRLLPLPKEEQETQQGHWDYIYEPDDAQKLLEVLLVRYVESQVYQAVVENIASEQSARMVAMQNATRNAGELIRELQKIYNKARQAGITREIAEIVAGAAAVE